MHTIWQTARFTLDLSAPKIMGIINITPDSFSDGGTYSQSVQAALKHAEQLLEDGADILDIGGESTRPNADYVPPEAEWQRVQPILAELARWNVPVSLDTRRAGVMRAALERGWADIINDVQGLEDAGAVEIVAQSRAGVCLMHMKGLPENMQNNPQYGDIAAEVAQYLDARAAACLAAGIAAERLVLDVGFGFGKTLAHNIALMQQLAARFAAAGGRVAQEHDWRANGARSARRARGGQRCRRAVCRAAGGEDCARARCEGNARCAAGVAGVERGVMRIVGFQAASMLLCQGQPENVYAPSNGFFCHQYFARAICATLISSPASVITHAPWVSVRSRVTPCAARRWITSGCG